MKRKILIPVIVFTALLSGAIFWSAGVAKANGNNGTDMASTLAQKLGISQDKVSTAMTEIRSERQAERRKEMSENLDKAVTDGVITKEQKQKILDHQAEMQQKRQKDRDAQKAWLEDSGIDMSKLQEYGIGMGKGMGQGGERGFGRDI